MSECNTNIYDKIKNYDEIIIVGHSKPDGDAIGSCLATALCLDKLGKKAKVILEDYSKRFDCIPGKEFIYKGEIINPQVFISLDCGNIDRFPSYLIEFFEKAEVTINIDHHISNNNFGDINFVDYKISSTSELIYNIFENIIEFDKNIASAIYAGIIYDTGGFRFGNTTPDTMRVTANLMEYNFNHTEIYTEIMFKNTIEEVKAISRGLENLIVDFENQISFSFFTLKELQELQISLKDLDFVVQYIMNIEGVSTGAFIYEAEENIFKVSLRSKIIDVNKVAGLNGGGGHVNASGCIIKGTKIEVYNKIKAQILKAIDGNE